jgi:hypothetical protein
VFGSLGLAVVAGGAPALSLTLATRPAVLGIVPSSGGGASRRGSSSGGRAPGRPAVALSVVATVGSAVLVVGADVVVSPAAALCRHVPSLCNRRTQKREHSVIDSSFSINITWCVRPLIYLLYTLYTSICVPPLSTRTVAPIVILNP